jgi:hypothetical protein
LAWVHHLQNNTAEGIRTACEIFANGNMIQITAISQMLPVFSPIQPPSRNIPPLPATIEKAAKLRQASNFPD